MKEYVIFRRGGPGFRETTGQRAGPASGSAGRPSVTVERVPEKGVAEIAADPEAEAAPLMPTGLIKPFAASEGGESGDWGIAAVGADRSAFDGQGVTVAVLDTGIDREHPAFKAIDGIVTKDFTGSGEGDGNGHGTHCAGTIFGRDIEGVGRIGIARGVTRALVGKVLDGDGGGQSDMVFKALTWALDERADIISMSLGFDFPGMVRGLIEDNWPADLATSTALEAYRSNLRVFDAIMDLLKARAAFGVSPLVIAAAGNESRRRLDPRYRIAASLPGAANDVVSVAAVGRREGGYSVADFSNSFATLSAPGVDIRSTWPGGGVNTISGTSMACPHVAGVAALWWQSLRHGGRTPTAKNVTARLVSNVRKDVLGPEFNEIDYGQGFVMAPLVSA